MKKKMFLIAFLALVPSVARAHCPLCTAGAGALAVGAAYIGVDVVIVGMFIGAFALALGLWIPRLIKKEYIRHQRSILAAVIVLSTIIPLMPLIQAYTSLNVFWMGEYGSVLNRTYMINKFVLGSAAGILIMYASPFMSRKVSAARGGKIVPYQGIAITFTLLIIVSLLIQFGV